jgi:hypothetical protein
MLNTGARALVETRNLDRMSVVIQEILQDKIYLDNSGQVQTRGMTAGDMARPLSASRAARCPSLYSFKKLRSCVHSLPVACLGTPSGEGVTADAHEIAVLLPVLHGF